MLAALLDVIPPLTPLEGVSGGMTSNKAASMHGDLSKQSENLTSYGANYVWMAGAVGFDGTLGYPGEGPVTGDTPIALHDELAGGDGLGDEDGAFIRNIASNTDWWYWA